MTLRFLATMAIALYALPAPAGEVEPRIVLYDGGDGATCAYFNSGAALAWRKRQGDWRDAEGRASGDVPFASAEVTPPSDRDGTRWDVTAMVRAWSQQGAPRGGFMLVAAAPARLAEFATREFADASARPRLHIEWEDGAAPSDLAPTADVELDCSTARGLGTRPTMRVGPNHRSALQFDVRPVRDRAVARATLVLAPVAVSRDPAAVGVFELLPPAIEDARVTDQGIAARYPRDAGIAKDPAVLFAADFESPRWTSAWTLLSRESHAERVARDDARGFEPLSGYAMRVKVAKGDNMGLDLRFDFKERLGFEPEDVYFRYYLRFASDWNPVVDGGKLPGLSGTYGQAGWGGRRSNAGAGWSMRGQFNLAPSPGNPLAGRVSIGTYAYHAGMSDRYGDHWYWMRNAAGILDRDRWYCIEQHVKVNTPGAKDGVLEAWVDGVPAFARSDIVVRQSDAIRIERVWMNVYHGGIEAADRDMHLYIDNVVVARSYVGCRVP